MEVTIGLFRQCDDIIIVELWTTYTKDLAWDICLFHTSVTNFQPFRLGLYLAVL